MFFFGDAWPGWWWSMEFQLGLSVVQWLLHGMKRPAIALVPLWWGGLPYATKRRILVSICLQHLVAFSTASTRAGPTNWPFQEKPFSPPPGTCLRQKKLNHLDGTIWEVFDLLLQLWQVYSSPGILWSFSRLCPWLWLFLESHHQPSAEDG